MLGRDIGEGTFGKATNSEALASMQAWNASTFLLMCPAAMQIETFKALSQRPQVRVGTHVLTQETVAVKASNSLVRDAVNFQASTQIMPSISGLSTLIASLLLVSHCFCFVETFSCAFQMRSGRPLLKWGAQSISAMKRLRKPS